MYIGWDGREYEDSEMENMRRDHDEELRQLREAAHNWYKPLYQLEHDAKRNHEYWELGGYDGPDPLEALEMALKSTLERVQELRTHQHQYDEDDYCYICGKDGRA